MPVSKPRLTRFGLAFVLALSVGGVYSAKVYAQEQEGIADEGLSEGGCVRIWCVTHERHETVGC